MKEYRFFMYIVSNYERMTFYVGFSNNLMQRMIEHKNGVGSYFTRRYKLQFLVYYEEFQYVNDAIAREKEIKGWTRNKKLELIKRKNPELNDLSEDLFRLNEITKEDVKKYIERYE